MISRDNLRTPSSARDKRRLSDSAEAISILQSLPSHGVHLTPNARERHQPTSKFSFSSIESRVEDVHLEIHRPGNRTTGRARGIKELLKQTPSRLSLSRRTSASQTHQSQDDNDAMSRFGSRKAKREQGTYGMPQNAQTQILKHTTKSTESISRDSTLGNTRDAVLTAAGEMVQDHQRKTPLVGFLKRTFRSIGSSFDRSSRASGSPRSGSTSQESSGETSVSKRDVNKPRPASIGRMRHVDLRPARREMSMQIGARPELRQARLVKLPISGERSRRLASARMYDKLTCCSRTAPLNPTTHPTRPPVPSRIPTSSVFPDIASQSDRSEARQRRTLSIETERSREQMLHPHHCLQPAPASLQSRRGRRSSGILAQGSHRAHITSDESQSDVDEQHPSSASSSGDEGQVRSTYPRFGRMEARQGCHFRIPSPTSARDIRFDPASSSPQKSERGLPLPSHGWNEDTSPKKLAMGPEHVFSLTSDSCIPGEASVLSSDDRVADIYSSTTRIDGITETRGATRDLAALLSTREDTQAVSLSDATDQLQSKLVFGDCTTSSQVHADDSLENSASGIPADLRRLIRCVSDQISAFEVTGLLARKTEALHEMQPDRSDASEACFSDTTSQSEDEDQHQIGFRHNIGQISNLADACSVSASASSRDYTSDDARVLPAPLHAQTAEDSQYSSPCCARLVRDPAQATVLSGVASNLNSMTSATTLASDVASNCSPCMLHALDIERPTVSFASTFLHAEADRPLTAGRENARSTRPWRLAVIPHPWTVSWAAV